MKLDQGLTVVLKVSLFSSTDPDGKSSGINDQVGNKTHLLLGFGISLVGLPPFWANELLVGEWKERTQQPSISTVVCVILVCFCQFKLIPIYPSRSDSSDQSWVQSRAFLSFILFHLFTFWRLKRNFCRVFFFLTLLWSTCGGDVLIFSADPLQLRQLGWRPSDMPRPLQRHWTGSLWLLSDLHSVDTVFQFPLLAVFLEELLPPELSASQI